MTTLPTTLEERAARLIGGQGLPAGGDSTPSAGDVFAMLRRRMVLVVVLFLAFSALAVAGFWVWWTHFPGFRSESLIECVSDIPEVDLSLDRQRLRQEEQETFVMTQAVALKTPAILEEALKVAAVRETSWFRSIPPDEPPILELTDELRVTPVRGTNYLRVSMVCRRREDPAVIVNTVVDRWYESVRRWAAQQLVSEPLEDAQEELNAVDDDVEQKRTRLREIASRLPAGALQNPGDNIAHQQIAQYAAQVAELKLELSQLEQFREVFSDPERIPVTAEDRALVEADPQVAELARTLFLMEQQRASDEGTFGAAHRERRQLDAQIRVTEERLAQLRAEKYRELRESRREATNTAYANTQHALFLSQENLARAEAMLVDQDQLLFAYQNLENEISQEVELQQQLNERIRSLNRVVRQQAAVDINVTQRATDPLEQHSPSLFVLPIGLFLALALSVGIALAVELLNKSIRTSQDISRYLRIPMLGAVPHTDDEEVAIKRVETAFLDTPQSMVAEAFRRIRTNLRFSTPVERQRSIIVTSPLPEDGKTTVACNLALAVAQEGQRVLLVDANFRRPAIHKCFEGSGPHGLSDVLSGSKPLESCVFHTKMSTLDVLGVGPIPARAAELLGGAGFQRLLEQATAQYEQVIIDTPPVLLTSDALVLAPSVGGVVLVVRANENTRGTARRASNLLANVKAHQFGAVLNAAQVTRGGYFREQLRAYYDYQPEVDAAQSQAQPPPAEPS